MPHYYWQWGLIIERRELVDGAEMAGLTSQVCIVFDSRRQFFFKIYFWKSLFPLRALQRARLIKEV